MRHNTRTSSGMQHCPEDRESMFPQKLVPSHQTRQCHITEDCNLFFNAIKTQTSRTAEF